MAAIGTIMEKQDVDSPVYTFLPDLQPPSVEAVTRAARGAIVTAEDGGAVEFGVGFAAASGAPTAAAPAATATFSTLNDAFREAKK